MKFLKMEGLGNDFVVLEGPRELQADEVTAWCDRRRGIGADGVLVVTPLADDRVRMEYWNADGSPAEMCGNGLRCVARLAHDRGWVTGDTFTVVTAVGEREARMGPQVTVQVGVPEPQGEEPIELAGLVARAVDVGNPHAVVFVEDPATVAVGELGPRLGTDSISPTEPTSDLPPCGEKASSSCGCGSVALAKPWLAAAGRRRRRRSPTGWAWWGARRRSVCPAATW